MLVAQDPQNTKGVAKISSPGVGPNMKILVVWPISGGLFHQLNRSGEMFQGVLTLKKINVFSQKLACTA